MSKLSDRIRVLEMRMQTDLPALFIAECGGEPVGIEMAGGGNVNRRPGESLESLKLRAVAIAKAVQKPGDRPHAAAYVGFMTYEPTTPDDWERYVGGQHTHG